LFSDEFYEGQLERTLAAAYADAADLGEVFAVARSIHRPTPDRWYGAWSERARAVTSRADDLAGSGQRDSARGAYICGLVSITGRATSFCAMIFVTHGC